MAGGFFPPPSLRGHMPGNLSTCIQEPTDFLLVSYVIFRPEPSESSPFIVGVGVTSQPSQPCNPRERAVVIFVYEC